MKVEGVDLQSIAPGPSAVHLPQNASASVVLIGMRGSGKTFVGELAANALGWTFVDADSAFEARHNTGVREFVHERGWPAFRAAETELLVELLASHAHRHVISLGGGIVETTEARELLKDYGQTKGPVVHVVREIDEVVKYLGEETARPAYGEAVIDVFRRREPWFTECSTHDFINYTGVLQHAHISSSANGSKSVNSTGSTTAHRRAEVARFFLHITGQKPNVARNVCRGKRSYFLSLTYPDIAPALPHIDELTAGADAVELRVDLLRSPKDTGATGNYVPPTAYVMEQLTTLRQATSLPIVFTVRSASQGGSHPDNAESEAFSLFENALRLGCEYIDVELSWSASRIDQLVKRKGHARIIASWHDWSGRMKWDGPLVREKYEQALRIGDIVKLVGKAVSFEDNFALQSFVASVSQSADAKPFIAINTGYEGQISRILNSTFSPVTHPLMVVKAAPGQLSFAQIQTALHLQGQLPARRFYLIGTPISSSPSPTLHNTGFKTLGLPHTYSLFETAEVDESVKTLLKAPDFGGASVTIPHKLAIIPLLDDLTPEAKAVGAVNTVICTKNSDGSRTLLGDNTDWMGILNTIRTNLPLSAPPTTGLIIGAGGTSRAAIYALHKLGLHCIYLFNRSHGAAEELAATFPASYHIKVIDGLESFSGEPPAVIVSTVPGAATSTSKHAEGSLYLPKSILSAKAGVAVDMAYRPSVTPLLSLALAAEGWRAVRGVDVLLEQGFAQFNSWTDRQCPRRVVTEHVLAMYNSA